MTTDAAPSAHVDARAGAARDTVAAPAATLLGGLADRDAWTAERCSVDRAFGVIGTRSALLILREAFYGSTRFDEFARRVGITEAVAAARLKHLEDAGLLRREPYREPGRRTRHEYHLTDMGLGLVPAVLALMQWGDTYLSDASGPPLTATHTGCGAPVHVDVRCDEGHDVGLSALSFRATRGRRSIEPVSD